MKLAAQTAFAIIATAVVVFLAWVILLSGSPEIFAVQARRRPTGISPVQIKLAGQRLPEPRQRPTYARFAATMMASGI